MKLIDKDALVAEIKRRIKFQQTCIKTKYRLTGKAEEEIILEYKQFLSYLDTFDTLEVKEGDLEKEIKEVQRNYKTIDEYEGYPAHIYSSDIELIAIHFFELGLKAQKGE